MCGIVGIIAFNDHGKSYLPMIHDAANSLKHRGPDHIGIQFPDDHVALGHARLSIIDLSEQSNQPFFDTDSKFHIIYNGEIFNFQEIKASLKSEGCTFNTTGDVEVLLKSYAFKHENCLQDLNGFFAFSIYEPENKKLFLARDRFGVKPLYYFYNEDLFCWSSELSAIQIIIQNFTLNKNALAPYFQLNYLAGEQSFVNGVKRLLPGHYIRVSEGKMVITKYFNLETRKNNIEYGDAKKEIKSLMELAVERRMISDVPVGCFLSGGIDSTIVTGIASKLSPHINTLSIGFRDNKQYDESHYAELASKTFQTNHHCLMLSNDDLLQSLDSFLDHVDEPFADSSALNVFILSKFAKQHVKVVLSGDGADEVFAGYNKHRAEWMVKNKVLFNKLIQFPLLLSPLFRASRQGLLANKFRQLKRYEHGLSLNDKDRYWRWASLLDETETNALLSDNYAKNDYAKELKANYTNLVDGTLNSILLSDVNLVLPFDMLTKVDMMSMANGLEVRSPFMDFKLIEFAFGLKESYKINAASQKLILKETFAHLIPQELLHRKKQGFEIPLQRWFTNELKSRIEKDWLNKEFIESQGIFNYKEIVQILKRLNSTSPGESAATIWALIVFNHWWRKNFKHA